MSFSASTTTTMDSVRRLLGFELTDGNGTTRCRLNIKVNLNTILCVLSVFFLGLLFGYIIFHEGTALDNDSNVMVTNNTNTATPSSLVQPLLSSLGEPFTKQEIRRRQKYIRKTAQKAWSSYVRYSWGEEFLRPLTKKGDHSSKGGYLKGLTLLQSLSTLWVMNLTTEYEQGREWVNKHFNLTNVNADLKIRQAVPRFLGSLLSIHALTKDPMYLEKILHLEKIITPAFSRENGLPFNTLKLKTLSACGDNNFLSTAGAYHLELSYLDNLLKNFTFNSTTSWRSILLKNRRTLASTANLKSDGLYMQSIDASTGTWNSVIASVQENTAPYFASLLHSYLLSNRTDSEAFQLYRSAIRAAERASLITKVPKSGLIYTRDFDTTSNDYDNFMHYEGCGLAGILALGADALEDQLANRSLSPVERRRELYEVYRDIEQAEGLAETCHAKMQQTKTGLLPSQIYFEDGRMMKTFRDYSHGYITPQLASSYFTLYRLSGEEKWREYAWELAHSIEYYCHIVDSGYSSLSNVEMTGSYEDIQPDDFIGGTLKYLYLVFSEPDDDNYLSLDKWVFNAVGQPIPVCMSL